MKQRMLSLALALALCLGLVPATAWAVGSDFTVENGVLTKYSGTDGEVVIPDGVTEIGADAFYFCETVNSVTIPDGVTKIGHYAFRGCTALTEVTVPASVREIDDGTFTYTPWLKSLGEFAVVNGILLLYQGDGGAVTIPDGVTKIGGSAFEDRADLTDVVIPPGVTSLGINAFYKCTNLTSVVLPEGVNTLENFAFCACSNLTSITIPASVTEIGEGTFNFCPDLTIYGEAGSRAETYAREKDVSFVAIQPTAPTQQPAAPASGTAYASTQPVLVDGQSVEFYAYALKDENGDPTNYVKLRDVAAVLNGTAAQFAVDFDGTSILLTTGQSYAANGSEMVRNFTGDQSYKRNASPVKIDGAATDLDAITLTDGNGGDYNYFKLRDLGAALGFNVSWDAENGITIDPNSPYSDAQ